MDGTCVCASVIKVGLGLSIVDKALNKSISSEIISKLSGGLLFLLDLLDLVASSLSPNVILKAQRRHLLYTNPHL